ncbi:MAG: hypothetical protein MSA33_08130, partial [Campylobacter sp.]|uniref:hypothetical protein n=1 Tax=Campylobacter sp. TaxID=205 RepID=UPI002AA73A57
DEYAKPKLNANADKEYLSGLKEWQRARILGSKAKANEALKTGDINSVFNAMKPERYKVKSINEVAKFQKENGTISPLKQPDEVNKANKANEVKEYNLINAEKEQIIQKIQNGFSTKQREFYVLGKTSIFGSEKRLILSSDTIKSHTHHQDIAPDDYAQIIDISKNIKYILAQSNIVYILLGTSNNKNYMLTLKNIANKDEIFAVSLLKLSKNNGIDKEYKRLSKKYKTVE